MMRRSAGFTLIEALVALMILALMSSFAIPSFREFTAKRQVMAAATAYLGSLREAQSAAVTRNRNIEVMFTSSEVVRWNVRRARMTSAAAGRRWIVRERSPDSQDAWVTGYMVDVNLPTIEMQAPVTSVGYTPLGRAVDFSTGARLPLAGNAVVRFTDTGTARRACAFLTPGGQAGVCDPERAAGEVQACRPTLNAGEC